MDPNTFENNTNVGRKHKGIVAVLVAVALVFAVVLILRNTKGDGNVTLSREDEEKQAVIKDLIKNAPEVPPATDAQKQAVIKDLQQNAPKSPQMSEEDKKAVIQSLLSQ